jgi:hypothetical protein
MPIGVKIIFTVALAAVALAFLFVDPQANNAGPNWIWRGGGRDGIRNIICRQDGSLRKYTKQSILAIWLAVLMLVWIVFPSV